LRFYRIELTNQNGDAILPTSLGGNAITSVLPNGQVNPAALLVELDIPVDTYDAFSGGALVRVWGLGLAAIGQAADLNGANIAVYGGMSEGLPLANPSQQGLLLKGGVLQAFGNWIGTDQTVDLIVSAPAGTQDAPLNFVLNWPSNAPMAQAITTTLKTVYATGYTINVAIDKRLVLQHAETGFYHTLDDFADAVNEISKTIITDDGYPGVKISNDGSTINVFDTSTPTSNGTSQSNSTPKAIAFSDMIGQPTWIGDGVVQVKLVLRGDLHLGDTITLPVDVFSPGTTTQTQATNLRFIDKTSFSGNFWIGSLHHYGNSRAADAASWVTVVNINPVPK